MVTVSAAAPYTVQPWSSIAATSCERVPWSPPPCGWMKVNVDAAQERYQIQESSWAKIPPSLQLFGFNYTLVFFSSGSDLKCLVSKMGSLGALMKHPDDFYPLLKLKMAARHAEQQIPSEPHWGFCFSMLHKVSRSFALVIQQLDTQLRNAVCIFYLVLRALDTVEDDTSVAADVKVPILIDFYRHIYNPDWHFSCELLENSPP
ncbi:hypothetical protein V6N11_038140 [Hibiscus sabdariffa]|uniref:Squalene synthase n=1 Tax=Hibiscus sabdariffa TaxID=183260 RepID=A0ABR2SJ19_9ROSI